jgi:coenzyme F420-reducing hydrogenase delta subunit
MRFFSIPNDDVMKGTGSIETDGTGHGRTVSSWLGGCIYGFKDVLYSVPCTGRVDIIHVLKAFENGAGVYLAGCLEGECHYLRGNLRAKKRVQQLKELLEECGVGGERVAMYNLSSAQGQRFAEIAREMTEKIRALGPNPVKNSKGQKRIE